MTKLCASVHCRKITHSGLWYVALRLSIKIQNIKVYEGPKLSKISSTELVNTPSKWNHQWNEYLKRVHSRKERKPVSLHYIM